MAIAYVNYARGYRWDETTNTLSISHTTTGKDRLLFVAFARDANGSTPSGTFNGIPLSVIGAATCPGGSVRRAAGLYLADPPLGTYTLTLTMSGNGKMALLAGNYTGVKKVSPLNASNTLEATSGGTCSLTTTKGGCRLIAAGSSSTGMAISNGVERYGDHDGARLFDSNDQRAAGSNSLIFTGTNIGAIVGAFEPAAPPGGAPILFAGGIAIL